MSDEKPINTTDSIGIGIFEGMLLVLFLPFMIMDNFDFSAFEKFLKVKATPKRCLSAAITFCIIISAIAYGVFLIGSHVSSENERLQQESYNEYISGLNQTVMVTDGMTLSLLDYRYIEIHTDLTKFENANVRMLMNDQVNGLFSVALWKEWVLEKKITQKTFRFDIHYIEDPLIFIEIEKPDSFTQYTYKVSNRYSDYRTMKILEG